MFLRTDDDTKGCGHSKQAEETVWSRVMNGPFCKRRNMAVFRFLPLLHQEHEVTLLHERATVNMWGLLGQGGIY